MSKKESIKKNKKYYYNVLPAYNINETLVYYCDKRLKEGTLVLLDLRKKDILGCILSEIIKPPNFIFVVKKIKFIHTDLLFDEGVIKFIKWFAKYNLVSLGSSLKLFLPNERIIKENYDIFFTNKIKIQNHNLSNKQKSLRLFLSNGKRTYSQLQEYKFNKTYIKKAVKGGLICEKKVRKKVDHYYEMTKPTLIKLNTNQNNALDKIFNSIGKNKNKPILFDGIMGSGKTEIYFKVIEKYIREKKQTLILLPEIALSAQWIIRFQKAFGFEPLIWNSEVSLVKKNLVWQSAIHNDSIVVVGARSALFLPFKNLGIIIIDEENDVSYKQEDTTIYNARDMAIVRANICFNSVLLVSATPSLESYKNAKINKYTHVKLLKRFNSSRLPIVKVIDMKKEKTKIISSKAIYEIRENLKKQKQSLILINRRGHAPIQICYKCGHCIKCKNCTINLVFHKAENCLLCHHCGNKEIMVDDCKKCLKEKSIIRLGFGIEKVYEEVKSIFDKEKIIMLSSDTINRKNFSNILSDIESNKIKIIIGTQIISKGFDFSNLMKVFLLDFDMWFHNSDIRTVERVFQLSQQVSGRAGRREEQGKVFIQTYDTKNKLLEKILNSDRDAFYKEELKIRNISLLPPYIKLAAIVISGKNLKETNQEAETIALYLKENSSLVTLGPIPAPIFFLKNEYRYRLVLKAKKPFLIQNSLIEMNNKLKTKSKIKLKIDIDPYSFF